MVKELHRRGFPASKLRSQWLISEDGVEKLIIATENLLHNEEIFRLNGGLG